VACSRAELYYLAPSVAGMYVITAQFGRNFNLDRTCRRIASLWSQDLLLSPITTVNAKYYEKDIADNYNDFWAT
jgi:hypothetical protein